MDHILYHGVGSTRKERQRDRERERERQTERVDMFFKGTDALDHLTWV
jgi:hypothetical protein